MFGYYSPILILQAICLFHAVRQQTAQKWYWIIIFLPVVGCAIYAYETFYNRSTISSLTEGVKEVVISNYKLDQLEKKVRFSDNIRNKINLADAYLQNGRYADAIRLYTECRQGFMADDVPLKMKLLHVYFLNKEYDQCVAMGRELGADKDFKNAEERISFAWALQFKGLTAEAEKTFAGMDRSFANYQQRHQYCVFLTSIGKSQGAQEKLAELAEEIDHMKGHEKRVHRAIIRDIRTLQRPG